MATEIAVADPELEELMAALEAETGVKVAPSPPPAAKVVSAVATTALSEEEEMLLALEADLNPEPVKVDPAAALPDSQKAEILAALEEPLVSVAVASVPDKIAEGALTGVGEVTLPADPDAELALLEAELNSAPTTAAITTEQTARAVQPVEEERGLSFIPGEVLVDPTTEPKVVAAVASIPELEAKPFDSKAAFALEDPLAGGAYYTDPTKFRVETSISDHDLDRCMIEQNGLRSFYGANAARAEAQADRLKLKFEVLEAKLYEEERRLAAEEGEKVTEKMLENRVKSNPLWMKVKLAHIDAQGVAGINKALVESLKDRKDMLVQLGADRRGEMQGATRVMASKDAAASERERATEAAQRAFQK